MLTTPCLTVLRINRSPGETPACTASYLMTLHLASLASLEFRNAATNETMPANRSTLSKSHRTVPSSGHSAITPSIFLITGSLGLTMTEPGRRSKVAPVA